MTNNVRAKINKFFFLQCVCADEVKFAVIKTNEKKFVSLSNQCLQFTILQNQFQFLFVKLSFLHLSFPLNLIFAIKKYFCHPFHMYSDTHSSFSFDNNLHYLALT